MSPERRASFLLLMLAWAGAAWPLSSDREQPIRIEADRLLIDERKGTMTYAGHARLRQGSILLTADELVVYSKERRFSEAHAQGRPAEFEQQTDDGKRIRARAHKMHYRASDRRLILEGEAELWQDDDHIRGPRIIYDMQRDLVEALGQKDSHGGGRVHITIQPPDHTEESPRTGAEP